VNTVQKNLFFFKKPNPLGFWGFYWVWALLGYFISTNRWETCWLISLISKAFIEIRRYNRLSKNSQIHYLLVVRSCKHEKSLLITGMTN